MTDWSAVDFADENPGVWPDQWEDAEFWMVHKGDKLPFAPWGDADLDVPCTKRVCQYHHDLDADEQGFDAD